jgi:hypothetical protein
MIVFNQQWLSKRPSHFNPSFTGKPHQSLWFYYLFTEFQLKISIAYHFLSYQWFTHLFNDVTSFQNRSWDWDRYLIPSLNTMAKKEMQRRVHFHICIIQNAVQNDTRALKDRMEHSPQNNEESRPWRDVISNLMVSPRIQLPCDIACMLYPNLFGFHAVKSRKSRISSVEKTFSECGDRTQDLPHSGFINH